MFLTNKIDRNRKDKHIPILAWAAVLLWMAVIFYLSSQPAETSNGLSRGVTEMIIKSIDMIYPLDVETSTASDWIDRMNNIVREYAHAAVFLILALFVLGALRRSGMRGFRAFFAAFAFCVAYALTDEVHQIFVPGRAWELGDLARDLCGALLGLVLYSIASFAFTSRASRKI